MMEDHIQNKGIVRLVLGLMLIGTVGVSVLKSGLDPITIVFWRSVIGTIFLLFWCFCRGILPDRTLTKRNIFLSLLAGGSLVLSWAAFFMGIIYTNITTATIIMHLQPFFIVLLSAVIWKDPINIHQIIWLFLAFVGVVLASGLIFALSVSHKNWIFGIVITLFGAVIYAVTAMTGKSIRGQRGEITTLFQTIMGILIFLPFVHVQSAIGVSAWGWLAVIGILQTGMAWVLIYTALPQVSTALVAVLSFVNPFVAIMADWLVFGRSLSLLQCGGLLLVIVSTLGMKQGWEVPWVSVLRR